MVDGLKQFKTLSDKLKYEGIRVDYLVHTGDIINSSDLYEKAASALDLHQDYATKETKEETNKTFDYVKFEKEAPVELKKRFNGLIKRYVTDRFKAATNIMREFVSDLNISFGNVIICCGNHDVLRPVRTSTYSTSCNKIDNVYCYNCNEEYNIFKPFEDFLNKLGVANSKRKCGESGVTQCVVGNLNILILNTNWRNPPEMKSGYYCVRCEKVQDAIKKCEKSRNMLPIVLAHKPIYEICEQDCWY